MGGASLHLAVEVGQLGFGDAMLRVAGGDQLWGPPTHDGAAPIATNGASGSVAIGSGACCSFWLRRLVRTMVLLALKS
jgi:hypothetical protein